MSKYHIIRACGCEDTIEVYGTNVHGERDRKVAYEETKMCKACYNKSIAQENETSGMIELDGTEKQRAWAEKIRNDFITQIQKKPDGSQENKELKEKVINTLKYQPSAKWWIDRQDSTVINLIKEVL